MKMVLDPNSVADYRTFVKAKALPKFRCRVGYRPVFWHRIGDRMTAEPMTQLRQCPFCQSEDLRMWTDEMALTANIACKTCGTHGPISAIREGETMAAVKERAKVYWQRRQRR